MPVLVWEWGREITGLRVTAVSICICLVTYQLCISGQVIQPLRIQKLEPELPPLRYSKDLWNDP